MGDGYCQTSPLKVRASEALSIAENLPFHLLMGDLPALIASISRPDINLVLFITTFISYPF